MKLDAWWVKIQDVMKITGTFSVVLSPFAISGELPKGNGVGSYMESMGHSSSLKLDGNQQLVDDGEGNLFVSSDFLIRLMKSEEIQSTTLNSSWTGVIKNISSYNGVITVTATGEVEGRAGSIMSGISCHAHHKLLAVTSVSGTFGTYGSMEAYEAAKAAHRAQYYTKVEKSYDFGVTYTVPVLTARCEALLKELGLTMPCNDWDLWDAKLEQHVGLVQVVDMADSLLAKEREAKRQQVLLAKAERLGIRVPEGKSIKFTNKPGERVKWIFV